MVPDMVSLINSRSLSFSFCTPVNTYLITITICPIRNILYFYPCILYYYAPPTRKHFSRIFYVFSHVVGYVVAHRYFDSACIGGCNLSLTYIIHPIDSLVICLRLCLPPHHASKYIYIRILQLRVLPSLLFQSWIFFFKLLFLNYLAQLKYFILFFFFLFWAELRMYWFYIYVFFFFCYGCK